MKDKKRGKESENGELKKFFFIILIIERKLSTQLKKEENPNEKDRKSSMVRCTCGSKND